MDASLRITLDHTPTGVDLIITGGPTYTDITVTIPASRQKDLPGGEAGSYRATTSWRRITSPRRPGEPPPLLICSPVGRYKLRGLTVPGLTEGIPPVFGGRGIHGVRPALPDGAPDTRRTTYACLCSSLCIAQPHARLYIYTIG